MQLALNIEDFSKPILSDTKKADILYNAGYFGKFLSFFFDKIKERLNKDLDRLIIMLEGYNLRIDELKNDTAVSQLKTVKVVFKELVKAHEKFEKINFMNDSELEDKFSYTLKTIYQTENKLHKVVYRNMPVEKSPQELIDGVMRMNGKYINELLSK